VAIELGGELLDDIRAGYLSGYKLDEPDTFLDLRPDMAKILWAMTRPSAPAISYPDVAEPSAARPKHRKRKPNIRRLIAEAEKTGKHVTSVTTPDGVTLTFGEPDAGDDAEAARR
jgi:hypothetical protein